MDKLLERCAKHRQATRGRKSKRTRSPRRNISKIEQAAPATRQALRTPTQTTNQHNKVAKNASSGHASTTKHAKDRQQAQTAPKLRRMKPDGTSKNPDDNPVMKHSNPIFENFIITEPGQTAIQDCIKQIENKSTQHTGRPSAPTSTDQTDSQAPGTQEDEGKKREGGKGLTALPAFSPQDRHPNANKLTRKAKTDVLALLAMGYTSKTVLIWLVQNYGIQVSRRNIDFMRNSQRKRIDQARQDISKKILESVPVASKLQRLTIRDELVDDLRRKLWRKTGIKMVDGKKFHEYKGSHETINKLLDSVKAEVEPLEINVSVNLRSKTAQQYADIPDGGVINEAMDKLKAAGMEVAQVVAPTKLDK